MAPGLIYEHKGRAFWHFKPEPRWNIFPDSAANNVFRFGRAFRAAGYSVRRNLFFFGRTAPPNYPYQNSGENT